ncbi:MAG: PTS mannitol transporter subunit IICBA [Actinomycetia bacterium]|nr:PTS mannitol transporter subunit IICBA [Actinomycetes bacterium]
MASTATEPAPRTSSRVRVQKFGTFLSNMIMPNIPALIAWGLFTAFFIPVGWTPNDGLATMVGPAIHYLLPILIAGTGGRMVYGDRGAVVGAFAVMGAIAGSDQLIAEFNATLPEGASTLGQIHMFIGAMILGPLAAWVMQKLDALWEGKIKSGFEMLVNMFSAGLVAFVMSIFGYYVIAPLVNGLMDILSTTVNWLVENSLLPLVSVVIEPAKVLFLNNAINHGVLTPLGLTEADQTGKSIMFLLEANPGPGLGLLLAYTFFGAGIARASAPGAAIIHFFGGIHEVYFPYVLMKPKLIIAMIAGGMTGVATNMLLDVGLRAPAAPGSIIAIFVQTASDSYFGVSLAVILSAAVTFAVAAVLLRMDRSEDEGDLHAATASMEEMKGKKSIASSTLAGAAGAGAAGPIRRIVFACDAGMGSSAMGASVLRKKIQEAGFDDVTVVNKAISNLADEFDLVVAHQDLTTRAQQRTGSAMHVAVDNFMASPKYDEIVALLQQTNAPAMLAPTAGNAAAAGATAGAVSKPSDAAPPLLDDDSIRLGGNARSRDDAITEAGDLLVASGAVDASYVAAMHEREQSVSTFMGNGLAIPHGTNEAKSAITRSAMSFVRYDEPIDWKGKPATFVIGIAGAGEDHLQLLQKIAHVFLDKDKVAQLESATSPEQVRAILEA